MPRLAAIVLLLFVPVPALAQKTNRPPELELPPYHRVSPGREIAFGLNVVDQDGDTVKVELVQKPATAQYDPVTLTVRWKPTAKDAPAGRFVVRVTEWARVGSGKRSYLHEFAVAVDGKAKDLPAPQPLGSAVELLITVHDPARLAQVNKDWPITRMLEVVGRVEVAKLPPGGPTAEKPDPAQLYKDALAAIALRHGNKRADPTSDQFDKKGFGDPKAWVITAVRPRMDKKVQELRVVYENVRVPEPMYLMFRFRLCRDLPDLAAEVRELNNKEFTRLVYETFLVGDALNPKYVTDKKAHGKAVSAFVGKVLDYRSDKPNMGTEFMALPHEARFGGGSKRAANGEYESGDGWAWAVLKAKWTPGAHNKQTMSMVSIGIPGFTTAIAPSKDRATWQTVCAPKFDPDNPKHAPGYEALCRKKLGFTDLPMVAGDGKIAPSPVDAVNLFLDYKFGDMVATVDLRDPRRDLFEENGMTCSQCHIRDFANGDLRDKATRDAKLGRLPTPSPAIPTTMFNIVPEETWRPFTIEFQKFQQCLIRDAFKKYQGVDVKIDCPLVAE